MYSQLGTLAESTLYFLLDYILIILCICTIIVCYDPHSLPLSGMSELHTLTEDAAESGATETCAIKPLSHHPQGYIILSCVSFLMIIMHIQLHMLCIQSSF